MARAKWMRLLVRDLADVLRWADRQNARQIDGFRYRVIHGREIVSFRLVPDYSIEIGTREIVVVAFARGRLRRIAAAWLRAAARRALLALKDTIERPAEALPSAAIIPLPVARPRRLPAAR
jgi:hypothetical protein